MKAVDYLDMPELISNEYPVYLDEDELEKYRSLKKELVMNTEEHEVTAANAAALSNKLSQMANGAVYSDEGDVITFHDKKLDALEDIIESANGKPLLVAYWYKHDYNRIVERLEKIGVEYGKIEFNLNVYNQILHKKTKEKLNREGHVPGVAPADGRGFLTCTGRRRMWYNHRDRECRGSPGHCTGPALGIPKT